MLDKEGPENPLLDRSDAAVKELIRRAKKRGYVTHDQINALLSSEERRPLRPRPPTTITTIWRIGSRSALSRRSSSLR